MASPSYDEILEDLRNQIHDKLERRDDPELRFARSGTARAVLQPVNLRPFFHSVVPAGISMEEFFGSGITIETLVSRTRERSLYEFLATLIYARCSIASARDLIRTLLTCSPAAWPFPCRGGRSINEFPVDRRQLEQIFSRDNNADVNSFINVQTCFCPVILLEGEDVQLFSREQRLPYLSDPEHVGSGSYGEVYRVEIAKGHLLNRHSSWANTTPKPMARKDFKTTDDFQQEIDTMKQILYTPRRSENILETFGSLQLDEGTFSLFMPLAECDLRVWMRNNAPPILESEKADILKCASGLADGLEFLHSEIRDRDGNRMVCYHMDLKPANILIFRDDRKPDQLIWKISDFGMSRVRVLHTPRDTDRDLGSLFQRRGDEMTISGTVNRRFVGTYLAPESQESMRKMNEKSDIWSLGCVISAVLTYLGEGQAGVDEYSEARANGSSRSGAGNSDWFFLLPTTFAPPKPHPTVRDWHKRLVSQARLRNPAEAEVLRAMLKDLEEKVLQLDSGRRESAKYIRDVLHTASAAYRGLGDESDHDEDHVSEEISGSVFSRWRRGLFRRPRIDGPKIESWILSDANAFTGCSIAPNGVIIAYWTDTCISLYNPQSFRPHRGRPINRVAYCPLIRNPWRSVKVTDRYLIASTRTRQPHIYLFNLKGGPVSGLNFIERHEIVVPINTHDGLHQIAISPGGEVIACVAHRDTYRAWVYYASIETLLAHKVPSRDAETTSSSSNEIPYTISVEGPWNKFSVNAAARNVSHIVFPSDITLCCVAQPEITREHNVKISYLTIPTRDIKVLPIENPLNSASRDFDSGISGRLFTNLTAIRNEGTFAIVLYETQLLVRNFQAANQLFESHTNFRNYRIVELLSDERHSRLIAFGAKSGSDTMLLMELPLTHLGHRATLREIRELPNLRYSSRFTARLVRGQNGYIIISVYAIGQPTLYKINLPKP
ncbi:kinase-like protein [Hypoxylon crocopeplum]|nr:kinase-like protein [Hypoxylon crocopeplum]